MDKTTESLINKRTNHHYGMKYKEIQIPMRDGSYLAANLYQPDAEGSFPVLMTMGPYGKDTHFAAHPLAAKLYEQVQDKSPYMNGGTPDPDYWVPQGYTVIRIDQRGIGHSPGTLDVLSENLKDDYFDAIEWVGIQPFCSGKVGLLGCSYYALSQWIVAQEQPPHLSCLVMWEGAPDFYADMARGGGIAQDGFLSVWYGKRVLAAQYGKEHLSDEQLRENRVDFETAVFENKTRNEWWKKRSCDLSRVTVPLLSAGNWFCSGFFSRGNLNGYQFAASKDKWLEMHIGSHFIEFYNEDSRALQKQFLDYWLKGMDTGLTRMPKIKFAMPLGGKEYRWMFADEYPFKNTKWTKWYLDADSLYLLESQPSKESKRTYEGSTNYVLPTPPEPFNQNAENPKRLIFKTKPFKDKVMLAGPIKLRVFAASSRDDTDIFVTLRDIAPDGKEVVNCGAYTLDYPITQGVLRASLRHTDESRSTEYKPCYTFDRVEKLIPGEVYPIDIELADSAMTIEKGNSIVLEVGSMDQSGCGIFLHYKDRIWGADITLYTGGQYESYLILPIMPE